MYALNQINAKVNEKMNDLIKNIDKLHTTEMGIERIRKVDDVVHWCKLKILDNAASIERKGKNWYATINNCIITVNAHSYTIITAHKTIESTLR